MNNNIIYINVGGKHFETTKETLSFCPYFQGIINFSGSLNCTKETPHFIDRDPKIFRHVLNLLRNPDYGYPIKYLDELEFYGFNIKEIRNLIQEKNKIISFAVFPILCEPMENVIIDVPTKVNSKVRSYIKDAPGVTFFNSVFSRHTDFEQLHTKSWFYKTSSWTHYILGDFILVDIYLLIPSYYYKKLGHFTITIGYGLDVFSFNLAALMYFNIVQICDDLCCIDLMNIFTRNQKLYIYANHDESRTISISLNHDLSDNIDIVLKLTTARLSDYERNKYDQTRKEYLLSKLESYEITNERFILPIGEIVFIIFNTTYDSIEIEYFDDSGKIIKEKNYQVSKFDARFLNNKKYDLGCNFLSKSFCDNNIDFKTTTFHSKIFPSNVLPEDYGLISFGLYDHFQTQPSGSLTSNGRQSIRFVHKDVEDGEQKGTIWIYKYCVVEASSSNGYCLLA